MTGVDEATHALRQIRGWDGAALTPLQGGSTNRSWIAERSGRRAVLKVDAKPRSAPFNDRVAEARIQRSAAEHELAGQVLYATPTILLTDYLDGEVWTEARLADDDGLRELAEITRRVHDLPLTGRRFDALAAAEQYAASMEGSRSATVLGHIEVIRSIPLRGEIRCCHNDLVVDNMIATPALRLIDWEYACDNDPMFDLATIVAHHGLSDTQAAKLADAYGNGRGPGLRNALRRQIRLYRSLYWLWRASHP